MLLIWQLLCLVVCYAEVAEEAAKQIAEVTGGHSPVHVQIVTDTVVRRAT